MAESIPVKVILEVDNRMNAAFASASSATDRFSKSLDAHKGLLTAAGVAYAAATAAVVLFAKQSVEKFAEAEKVGAQLAAVLKSTGEVAGVTAGMADRLSESLVRTSTYSKEAAKSAEALLLTFTNIHADTFPRALEATANLSTAMGIDLSGAAVQLGKALNDPTVGIQALTRVGVTFSAGQKKVITALAETGDMAGAQRLILDELTKEFGGSASAAAETYAGRMEQLRNRFDDVQQKVGQALIPVLANLGEVIVGASEDAVDGEDKMAGLYDGIRQVAELAASAANRVAQFGLSISALGAQGKRLGLDVLGPGFGEKDYQADMERIGALSNASNAAFDDFVYRNEQARAQFTSSSAAAAAMGGAAAGAYGTVGAAAADAAKKAKEAADKIKAVDKELDAIRAKGRDEAVSQATDRLDASTGVVGAYAAQEGKVAELRKKDADEGAKRREKEAQDARDLADLRTGYESAATDDEKAAAAKAFDERNAAIGKERADRQAAADERSDQIAKESGALARAATVEAAYPGQVAAERRRADLTDFERQMADIEAKAAAKDAEHQANVKRIDDELAAKQRERDGLAGLAEEVTRKEKEEIAKREKAALDSAARKAKAADVIATGAVSARTQARIDEATAKFSGPAAGGGAGGGGGGSWGDGPSVSPLPTAPPTIATAINFIFNGDVVDRDRLISDVKGSLNRESVLRSVAGK